MFVRIFQKFYIGIFPRKTGKTCENLRQVISDSAEIRNSQLQDKIRMCYGLKHFAVLYAVFHTAAVYCTIIFKDFSPLPQTLHTRERIYSHATTNSSVTEMP
jgi:hypothetical protein